MLFSRNTLCQVQLTISLQFIASTYHLSKHCTAHDPLHIIYNGPHLPSRKSQILEHRRTGEDTGSTLLGCRSIGFHQQITSLLLINNQIVFK